MTKLFMAHILVRNGEFEITITRLVRNSTKEEALNFVNSDEGLGCLHDDEDRGVYDSECRLWLYEGGDHGAKLHDLVEVPEQDHNISKYIPFL